VGTPWGAPRVAPRVARGGVTPDPRAAPSPDVRTTLRDVERLAFVARRALDEGDRDAERAAIDGIRERVRRLP